MLCGNCKNFNPEDYCCTVQCGQYHMKAAFPVFSRIITHHGRDSMRLALSLNDILRTQIGEEPFSSVSLQSLKLMFDIDGDVQHNALEDARDTAHVYRKLTAMLRAG